MRKVSKLSQVILIVLLLSIIVVSNIDSIHPSTIVNILIIISLAVALFQVYIQRKIKNNNEQDSF